MRFPKTKSVVCVVSISFLFIEIHKHFKNPNNKNSFAPQNLMIMKGTDISWINDDTTLHTVTPGSPIKDDPGDDFDSAQISPGKTFDHKFDFDGKFEYYCTLHPYMNGPISVS